MWRSRRLHRIVFLRGVFIYLPLRVSPCITRTSIYLSICPGGALQFKSSSNYDSQSIIERFDLRLFRRSSSLLLHLGSCDTSNIMRVWIMEMKKIYIYIFITLDWKTVRRLSFFPDRERAREGGWWWWGGTGERVITTNRWRIKAFWNFISFSFRN